MDRCIEWIQAEQENGMTTPVVPNTDKPPTIPSRPFKVRCASFLRPEWISLFRHRADDPRTEATSSISASIIRRGPGLIAGSPTSRTKPSRVTVPTPFTALKETPRPARSKRARTTTSAPCVTSGSSPASFTIETSAVSPSIYVAPAKAPATDRPAMKLSRSLKLTVQEAP